MKDRLRFIKSLKKPTRDPILTMWGLRREGLVSPQYSKDCLSVDLWWIEKQGNYNPLVKNFKTYTSNNVQYSCSSRIFLWVVIRALLDVSDGRPCDVGLWLSDLPPGGKNRCREDTHICSPDAIGFLKNLDAETERCLGLEPGTVNGYLQKVNKSSPRFQ